MNLKTILSALAVVLVLAACGNKGPLVMPEPQPPAQPVTTPAEPAAAAAPATTESGTPAR